jgi:hypothetical protein
MCNDTDNNKKTKKSYAHYRYDMCNDTDNNRKTCFNRQSIYYNTTVCKYILFIYLSCYGILLYYSQYNGIINYLKLWYKMFFKMFFLSVTK